MSECGCSGPQKTFDGMSVLLRWLQDSWLVHKLCRPMRWIFWAMQQPMAFRWRQ